MVDPKKISRRKFLARSAGALAGAYLGFSIPKYLSYGFAHAGTFPGHRMRYRELGKTGLKMPEVGFGGYPARDPAVVEYAIDQGMTYFDTSDDYTNGVSESTIGEGTKRRRDEVVITTKWHPWSNTRADEMLRTLDTSLKRLQTDHVDFLLVHQIGKASGGESIERLENSELFKAIETAKKQGKVRFTGASGHDGDLMEVMNYAIEIPIIDLILCRYSFMDYPAEPDLFRRAKEKGVAVVAMKTLAGARGENLAPFKSKHATYKQAALKWVLSNQDISGLIISISSPEQVDEYKLASGPVLTTADSALLAGYADRFGSQHCRMCNECEPSCPHDLKIADTLRYSMYFHHYKGMQEEAGRLYANLPSNAKADACLSCAAPCQENCSYGVNIKREMGRARRGLSGAWI
ncbi:MAG: aldo/keto reductase [Candidatus Omnitrophica bacterium]|nr:aldo/keto reductase [Candidatus Omnitrophota bacterium]